MTRKVIFKIWKHTRESKVCIIYYLLCHYTFFFSPFRFICFLRCSFLMHYAIISVVSQSCPCGYPLRLRFSTLTSTKARTLCQPEAPCRLTAPEVRNKKTSRFEQPWKNKRKGTMQPHQLTQSLNNVYEMWWSCWQTNLSNKGCSYWLKKHPNRLMLKMK